jgi:hypothetical protein
MFIHSTERNIVIGNGTKLNTLYFVNEPAQIQVAARSKTCICSHSISGIAGSNPAVGMDVCHLRFLSVVGKSGSLLQSMVCLSVCDHEASIVRRLWPTVVPLHEEKFGMAIHSTTNCYQYRFPIRH